MKDNLPNFTADEKIEYQSISDRDEMLGYRSGTFEYLAVLTPTSWGASVQETRTATHETQPFLARTQDRGVPEMALIFLSGTSKRLRHGMQRRDYVGRPSGLGDSLPAAAGRNGPYLVLPGCLRRS